MVVLVVLVVLGGFVAPGGGLAPPAVMVPPALPVRLAARGPAGASARAAAGVGGFERGGDGPHQPGVDRKPFPGGRLFDAGLEVFGDPQRDPRRAALVGVRRRWYRPCGRPDIRALGRLLVRPDGRR